MYNHLMYKSIMNLIKCLNSISNVKTKSHENNVTNKNN